MSAEAPGGPEGVVEVPARIQLFGFDPAEARAFIRPRPRAWRVSGALRTAALSLVVAPLVGVVPPHAPWVLGALGTGGFLARRRWTHRFTLEAVEASCPKCGAQLEVVPSRLRSPHTLTCEGCHYEATLEVRPNDLEPLLALTA